MVGVKCSNFILCNHYINTNIDDVFCNDCLIYFNYKLSINKYADMEDITNSSCPICLSNDENLLFIKQKKCHHLICIDCIRDIYFDKRFLRQMPKNPITKYKKSWNLFIYSNRSVKINSKFVSLLSANNFNSEQFNLLVDKYKHLIPSIFKKNFEELVKFQIKKNKYISQYRERQAEKIKVIKKCPYCRTEENILIIMI